jgi:hypothetical protein
MEEESGIPPPQPPPRPEPRPELGAVEILSRPGEKKAHPLSEAADRARQERWKSAGWTKLEERPPPAGESDQGRRVIGREDANSEVIASLSATLASGGPLPRRPEQVDDWEWEQSLTLQEQVEDEVAEILQQAQADDGNEDSPPGEAPASATLRVGIPRWARREEAPATLSSGGTGSEHAERSPVVGAHRWCIPPSRLPAVGRVSAKQRRMVLHRAEELSKILPPADVRPRPPAAPATIPEDSRAYFFNNPAHVNPYADPPQQERSSRGRTWRTESQEAGDTGDSDTGDTPLADLALAVDGRSMETEQRQQLETWLRRRGVTREELLA